MPDQPTCACTKQVEELTTDLKTLQAEVRMLRDAMAGLNTFAAKRSLPPKRPFPSGRSQRLTALPGGAA